MKNSYLKTLAILALSFSAVAMAQDSLEIDASTIYAKPLTAVGRTDVEIDHLNVIRYHIQIGRDRAETDGPSLALLGFPVAPKADDGDGGNGESNAASTVSASSLPLRETFQNLEVASSKDSQVDSMKTVGKEFDSLTNGLDLLATDVSTALGSATGVKKALDERLEFVNRLVAVSDNILRADNGSQTLATRANEEATHITMVLQTEVPVATPFYQRIAGLQAQSEELMIEPGFPEWIRVYPNNRKWEIFKGRLSSLPGKLAPLEKGSNLRNLVATSKSKLSLWRDALEGLNEESFSRTVKVECNYPFWQTREHTVELHTVDRLEADVAKATRKQTVARIVCPSSIAVSGGFAVGGVDEEEYGFVQTANGQGGVKSTIGRLSSGSEAVNGLLLGHFRMGNLSESPKHAWYLSTGTLVSFGDTESRLGYVFGGSFSFTRSLFLTVGAEARRSHTLSGGFKLGDDVPEGLTEPPTEKEWEFRAVLGVSIAIR